MKNIIIFTTHRKEFDEDENSLFQRIHCTLNKLDDSFLLYQKYKNRTTEKHDSPLKWIWQIKNNDIFGYPCLADNELDFRKDYIYAILHDIAQLLESNDGIRALSPHKIFLFLHHKDIGLELKSEEDVDYILSESEVEKYILGHNPSLRADLKNINLEIILFKHIISSYIYSKILHGFHWENFKQNYSKIENRILEEKINIPLIPALNRLEGELRRINDKDVIINTVSNTLNQFELIEDTSTKRLVDGFINKIKADNSLGENINLYIDSLLMEISDL